MNRILIITVFILAVLLPQDSRSFAISESQRYLVVFKDKTNKELILKTGAKVSREFKNLPALTISVPPRAVAVLKKHPNVAAIEADIKVKSTAQTADWGIGRTGANRARKAQYTGKGVKIAVIDTGIAPHDDLIISGGASFVSYTSSYFDDNGHGTHVAGIIAARDNGYGTVGIAPEASLFAVKALGRDGEGYLSDLIAGIDWCITNRMDIINLSIGSALQSYALKQAADRANSLGILLVAAAGNDGTVDGSGDNVNYPGRYDSVIAVASVNFYGQRSAFSSTGSLVEVAAPGENIKSTYLNNGYAIMSGTSMAAPYVSGNLALLRQANPTLSHAELRKKLREEVIDLGPAGPDPWYGFGLIQAPGQQESSNRGSTQQGTQTRTAVSVHKTAYPSGMVLLIHARVASSDGKPLAGAKANITIKLPDGAASSVNAITDSNGLAMYIYDIPPNAAKGSCRVIAQSSLAGFTGSSASTSFQLH